MRSNSQSDPIDSGSGRASGSSSGSSSRRSRRSGRSKKLEKQVTTLKLLLLLAVVACVAIIAYFSSVANRPNPADHQMLTEIRDRDRQIGALESDLGDMTIKLDQLVKGRIPGLTEIDWGNPIELSTGVVKKIIFTINKRGQEQSYQYLASLHNKSSQAIQPKISILLFNSVGIQIGSSKINQDNSLDAVELSLEIDEIRSNSDTIAVPLGEEPKYFLIRYIEPLL